MVSWVKKSPQPDSCTPLAGFLMTAPTKLTSKDILFCASEFQYCVLNPKQVGARRVMQIRWERPQQGWIRLNTEGASSGNPGLAGRGGILRNEHGEWIKGFSRNIGRATSFAAKL